MSSTHLLKAKSIIEKYFVQGTLEKRDELTNEPVGYCALGAIAKAHDLSDIEEIAYSDIPLEDIVVLAATMDKSALEEAIENIKAIKARWDTIDRFYSDITSLSQTAHGNLGAVVYLYNDSHKRDEVVEKFKEACKDYDKHLHYVQEIKEIISS